MKAQLFGHMLKISPVSKEPPLFGSLVGLFIFFSAISPSFAAEFFSDFNNGLPPKTAVLGTALIGRDGGFENSGVLKLTETRKSQVGSFVLKPLDGDLPLLAFTVEFKMLIGGGSGGDGLGMMFH